MPEEPPWPAIAGHGRIRDLGTCALDGTIDWFCASRFDSPSVFGAILDRDRGGCWGLAPTGEITRTQQFNFPNSAVPITRFLTSSGVVEVHAFMPIVTEHDTDHQQRLVRRINGVRGTCVVRMRLDARPDYGRAVCIAEPVDGGVLLTGDGIRMGLTASAELESDDGVVSAEVELSNGDIVLFVLEILDDDMPSLTRWPEILVDASCG